MMMVIMIITRATGHGVREQVCGRLSLPAGRSPVIVVVVVVLVVVVVVVMTIVIIIIIKAEVTGRTE